MKLQNGELPIEILFIAKNKFCLDVVMSGFLTIAYNGSAMRSAGFELQTFSLAPT